MARGCLALLLAVDGCQSDVERVVFGTVDLSPKRYIVYDKLIRGVTFYLVRVHLMYILFNPVLI
jgi:hypothetical protein